MMIFIAAAAVAAAQPATPVAPDAHADHASMMQMGDGPGGQHAMKEKCCCEDMAGKHEGHGTERGGHGR
jgi:hypothetical protein